MSVARLNFVYKSRKPPGLCGTCHHPIDAGDSYAWYRHFRRPIRVFHNRPVCLPSKTDRESNEKRRDWMLACDAVGEARSAETAGGTAAALREGIDLVRTVVDQLQDSLGAWEGTGLAESEQARAFEETAEELEDWADTHERLADQLEDLAESEPDAPAGPEPEDPAELELYEQAASSRADWESAVADAVDEIEDPPELTF